MLEYVLTSDQAKTSGGFYYQPNGQLAKDKATFEELKKHIVAHGQRQKQQTRPSTNQSEGEGEGGEALCSLCTEKLTTRCYIRSIRPPPQKKTLCLSVNCVMPTTTTNRDVPL